MNVGFAEFNLYRNAVLPIISELCHHHNELLSFQASCPKTDVADVPLIVKPDELSIAQVNLATSISCYVMP